MIPSLIRLYCSIVRFLKMLLSLCESEEQCVISVLTVCNQCFNCV